MSLLLTLITETEEKAPLLMPPLAFAGIAVAIFLLLGFVTWSFRDGANRPSNKTATGVEPQHVPGP